MRVAIVGSRECGDQWRLLLNIVALLEPMAKDTVVVSGGARGVDSLAAKAAARLGLRSDIYPANWKALGKRAGFARNQTIVDNSDVIHAFWDGRSRGTRHTIQLARTAGKPVHLHPLWPLVRVAL